VTTATTRLVSFWAAASRRRAEAVALTGLGPPLGTLILLIALVPLRDLWPAQLVLVAVLFVIPGILLLRALRVPGELVAAFPVYVPCASLVVLLGSGLAVDLIAPALGLAQPLRPWPLLAGLEIVCLALAAAGVWAPRTVALPWQSIAGELRHLWPLVLPLLAAAGALRLNSGRGNEIAVLAIVGVVIVVILGVLRAPRLGHIELAVMIYAAALAMIWSSTLRSSFVYGWDIATEFFDLHYTIAHGVWVANHTNDAYGAMLSVTVLPAELHALTGMADLLIFKALYPAIFALLPVGVFYLGRRILANRWAFIGAGLVLVQDYFAHLLSAVARQEIALLLFIALTAAMLETNLRRSVQWPFVLLLGFSLAVSHYSTAYFTIALIGVTLLLQLLVSFFHPISRTTGGVVVAFAAVLAGAALWNGPITHSGGNALQFERTFAAHGLQLLPNRTPGESLVGSYLHGNMTTAIDAESYERAISQAYAEKRKYVVPLPEASDPRYRLHDSGPPTGPADPFASPQLVLQQLVNVLAGGAALILVFRRSIPPLARQFGLLTLSSVGVLMLFRVSGTLAAVYNQERALLQGLVFLTIALGWLAQGLASRRWIERVVLAASVLTLVVLLAGTSGLTLAAVGGNPAINLANQGEDFERFYMSSPELSAATWLGRTAQSDLQLVYADRYGQIRLFTADGSVRGALLLDVTPLTLDRHAWVYASRTNVADGRARALLDNRLASYTFPREFLHDNYNILYANGSSEVFHR
jgi:uncharacterized membrane protein